MTTNEAGVYFFPAGGHNHDGENSSLIDVNAYSIFDFNFQTNIGTPTRRNNQERNFLGLSQLVDRTVRIMLINEAGVIIQPGSINGGSLMANTVQADTVIVTGSITAPLIQAGTITADRIAAGTITADRIQAGVITGNLLNANVVLVNQTILSNNYVTGVSGWAIDGDGTAEFDAASIRGTLTAAAVSTPGVDIHANGVLQASNFIIEANGAFGNNNFAVDASGNLFANNANITGVIEATGGLIGDLGISNGQLVYTDNINDTGLMLGPRSFPTNDGAPALVISSSFGSGSFTSVRAVGIDMTGNINCNAVDSEFLTVIQPINGDINGNASTADQATTALNADKLDNFFASTSDVINTVAVRGNDASVRASYLIMTGGVGTTAGNEIRKRNDGYLLTFVSRRELKNSIENIDSDFALSTVSSLQPVSFRMNEMQYIGDLFSEKEATYREYGFIAQDIAEIDVNLATYSSNAEGDAIQPQAWSSHAMISLSVAAIKGLIAELNELKSKVSELESYLFNGPNNEV